MRGSLLDVLASILSLNSVGSHRLLTTLFWLWFFDGVFCLAWFR